MLHRLILSLKVQCTNTEQGCQWFGELSELEEHLDKCSPVVDNKALLKEIPKEKNCEMIYSSNNNITHDIMLSFIEQLNFLNTKVDVLLDGHISKNTVANNNVSKQDKKLKKSSIAKRPAVSTNTMVPGSRRLLLLLFIALLVVIFLFNSQLFKAMQSNSISNEKPVNKTTMQDDLFDSVIQSQLNSSFLNESSISESLLSMHKSMNRKWKSLFQVVAFNFKYQLLQLQIKKNTIMTELTVLNNHKNASLFNLENTIKNEIESTRHDINTNISVYDEQAFMKGVVEHHGGLWKDFQVVAIKLNNSITKQIHDYHNTWNSNEKLLTHSIQNKLQILQSEVRFFADYIFADNIYLNELKPIQDNFMQYQHLITQHSKTLDHHIFTKQMNTQTTQLLEKYSIMLLGYNKNVSNVLSYRNRFEKLVFQLTYRRNPHGVHIWKINVTNMLKLPTKQAIHSKDFLVSEHNAANLYLYRDDNKKHFWKLTYVQQSSQPSLLDISMYNQNMEEMLPFKQTLTGNIHSGLQKKYQQFYSIPLNIKQMRRKGFIKDDVLYIRCYVVDS